MSVFERISYKYPFLSNGGPKSNYKKVFRSFKNTHFTVKIESHFSNKNGPQKHSTSIVVDVVFSFSDYLNPDKKVCKKSTRFFALTFGHKNLFNIDVTETDLSYYRVLNIAKFMCDDKYQAPLK